METLRDKFLNEFSLSKEMLRTDLYVAINSKMERMPIFIKSNNNPTRDVFWDVVFTYKDDGVIQTDLYYRDSKIYEPIDLGEFDNTIIKGNDLIEHVESICDYADRLVKICFEKFAIKIVE